MKQHRRQGYVLVLVMIVLFLIGTELFVLSRISQSMMFHTDTAYLQAQGRNMVTSAVAWLRQQGRIDTSTEIKLDMDQLKIPQANCSVSIVKNDDAPDHFQIKVYCTRARRTFKKTVNWSQSKRNEPY